MAVPDGAAVSSFEVRQVFVAHGARDRSVARAFAWVVPALASEHRFAKAQVAVELVRPCDRFALCRCFGCS